LSSPDTTVALAPCPLLLTLLRCRCCVQNAFVYICAERARAEAKAQAALDPASVGPLYGGGHTRHPHRHLLTRVISNRSHAVPVPFGVKDLEDVKGLPTSYGTVPLMDNIATQDSVVVERLRAAGGMQRNQQVTP
jgi:hypothetical protein